MQLLSEENIKVSDNRLNIEDALKKNNVSLKIEAAHAGVMNGNYLFYLPKALKYGSDSLNKFYKPLQKKHYSKTLGYIYNSEYIETKTNSEHYQKIVNSKDSKELITNVKQYIKTAEYENNRTGFGVLIAKAKLHDQQKISDLKSNDIGTVSVAGDAGVAYCSICGKNAAVCGHKLGQRYKNNELCFGIVADEFEVDHISFETIPANWETNSLIIADSQLLGNIELIEEGQLMKLSLDQLKEKLGNIESVLAELNLSEYIKQYETDVTSALKSQFLLSAEQLLPFSTPLTTYVTEKLLSQLEDSEDKQVLTDLFGTSYSDIFDGKTEEEVTAILSKVKEEVQEVVVEAKQEEVAVEIVAEPVVDEPVAQALAVTDADKIALAIADTLTATFDTSFQNILGQLKEFFTKEQEVKANKILEEQVKAYKEDLTSSGNINTMVTEQLKESLINQIVLLKSVDVNSQYYTKLKDRTVQELKMTLEDHVQLSTSKVEVTAPVVTPVVDEVPLVVKDADQHIEKIDVTLAADLMNNEDKTVLEITDADKIVETVISGVENKLTKTEFSNLYKKTVFDHGSKIAKKLHSALKAQNKI